MRALLSVSDKTGIADLARGLVARGWRLLSTGGTARLLRTEGIAVEEVADYTGAPEILDGRVKTLHPRIHAGLLARPTDAHRAELAAQGIEPIDLLAVNLYPFVATVAREGVTMGEAIENIDIGGPTMLRAAAKNWERVTVLVDPADYATVLTALDGAGPSSALRFSLATKVFQHTAAYDAAVSNFLGGLDSPPADDAPVTAKRFPETLTLQWRRAQALRYGENPHQSAALYVDDAPPPRPSVPQADVLQGKELSFNNLLDLDAALALALEYERPAVAIVKHNNPCGVAVAGSLVDAWFEARECDPASSFGGVVAVNRPVDEALARMMSDIFLECIIAPAFDDAARAILSAKKNLRLLAWRAPHINARDLPSLRSIAGGVLVQERDSTRSLARDAKVVTRRAPTDEELRALDFAWAACKHVKSNAIVFARAIGDSGAATVGIGAGQMSRVDSVRIAVEKARSPITGTVVASDAFFPFRDGLDAAAVAGATAVIQPGGSVRDQEIIDAANEHGLAMVFTGVRHFRH